MKNNDIIYKSNNLEVRDTMKKRYESKVAVFLILTRETNKSTEIMLQRRCNTGYMDGKYDMACSGHLEEGESLSMAVVREAKEELGIDIQEKDLKLVSVLHPWREGYINVFFSTQRFEGIPQIIEKEKCDDLRWFDINNLPDNTIEKIKHVIKCMKNGIIYDDGDFSHLKMKQTELERYI